MEATSRDHTDKAGDTSRAKKERHARPPKKRSATHAAKSRTSVSRPGVVGFVRGLPKTLGVQLRAHPPETVAAIGAVSFALGQIRPVCDIRGRRGKSSTIANYVSQRGAFLRTEQ